MYFSRFFNHVGRTRQVRFITNYPTLRDTKPAGKPIVVENAAAKAEQSLKYQNSENGHEFTPLTNWDKKVLLLTRTYKSKDDIPEKVKLTKLDKARVKLRRQIGIFLAIFTLFLFYLTAKSAKSKAKEGDVLFNRNLVTHGKKAAE